MIIYILDNQRKATRGSLKRRTDEVSFGTEGASFLMIALLLGMRMATALRWGAASRAALVMSAQGWTGHKVLARPAPFV
jgi:hypothetical protein